MTTMLTPTRTEIDRVNASFSVALRRGDAAGMAMVYTTEAQIWPPHAESRCGKTAIQAFWEAALGAGIAATEMETLEFAEQDATAWEVGRATLKSKEGQVIDEVKYLVIWQREQGVWKWHRQLWNSNRAPT
ncbi:MAG: DUF4440 domain-containing protein [Caldilinea sp. CFX5]|nr:DUF4440 domain-containing protein [Caldilinea sp. CFX5]